jgi:hypothetical protein
MAPMLMQDYRHGPRGWIIPLAGQHGMAVARIATVLVHSSPMLDLQRL